MLDRLVELPGPTQFRPLRLDHDRSRIMLCGNPEMVEDSRKLLLDRGYRLSRRGDPGHLAVENYW